MGNIFSKDKAGNSQQRPQPVETQDWIKEYCQNIVRSEQKEAKTTGPDLAPTLGALSFEEEGDYSRQIERLNPVDSDSLFEVAQNNRRLIILSRAGSGKNLQIHDLLRREAQLTLLYQEKTANRSALELNAGRSLVLPIYLNLAELELGKKVKDTAFQAVLTRAFNNYLDRPAPANLFDEIVPLVLADNLEGVDPATAPGLLYAFNQWCKQIAAESRVVVACQHPDFILYHPWFKAEQQWQFYAMLSFEWEKVRVVLGDKFAENELQKIEQLGLTPLLTHPALFYALQPLLETGPADLNSLLKAFLTVAFNNKAEWGLQLARYSRWLEVSLSDQTRDVPECLQNALKLGLVEKHPVTGEIRLANPTLEWVMAAWFCQAASSEQLPLALNRILETAQPDEAHNFLKLLYLLTGLAERPKFFTALLGQLPAQARLNLLIDIGRIDPDFNQSWQAYLATLNLNPGQNSFGLALLKLCGELGAEAVETGGKREQLRIAEIALKRLIELENADDSLYLELAQVQEALGERDAAMLTYRRLAQELNTPSLDGMLGIIRLLVEEKNQAEAVAQLARFGRRLKDYQAESDFLSSVLKRQLKDFETALSYAKHAVYSGTNPKRLAAYRYNLALTYFAQGGKNKAEQELTKLVRDYPTYAEAFYELGRLQMERGAIETALANLRRAVELEPAKAHYLYDLGRSLMVKGQYQAAYPYLQAAANQAGAESGYQLSLGLVALKLAKLEEARLAFRQVLQTGGEKAVTLVYLAATEYAATNYRAAGENLSRAQKIEPENATLYVLAGLVAEPGRQVETAISNYHRALDLNPQAQPEILAICHLRLAQALILTNNLEEADVHSKEAARLRPGVPELFYLVGLLALKRKRFGEAAECFGMGADKLTKNESDGLVDLQSQAGWLSFFATNDDLQYELPYWQGLALRELGQHEEAQKVLHGLIRNLPADRSFYRAAAQHQMGLSLLTHSELQEALAYLGQAVAEEPKNASYRLGLAKGWQKAGDNKRALAELNQAQELAPTQPDILAEIAGLQLQTKTLDATLLLNSLNLYLKALAKEPSNPNYLYQGARLAYHLSHQNQAAELLSRLLQISPNLIEAHLLAACNLERIGNLDKAQAEIGLTLVGAVQKQPGYFLLAARLARKAGALDTLRSYLAPLNQREALPLNLQAAIRAEEGWLAMSQKNYQEAAVYYERAIGLRQQIAASDTSLKLDELYYDDCNFEDLAQTGYSGGFSSEQLQLANCKLAYAGALRQAGLISEAIHELDEAISLNPRYAPAYTTRGQLLAGEKQYAEALDSFKNAAEIKPTPARYYDLGLAYLNMNEATLAVQALERAASSSEIANRSEFQAKLGLAYQKSWNSKAARTAYTRGLQLDPNNIELYLALADSYLQDGERMAAVQPLQEAIVRNPNNPLCHQELAYLYEQLDWCQEAAGEYEQVTVMLPDEAAGWVKSGQMLLRINKIEDGRAALEHALRLDANQPTAHYELGQLYLKTYQGMQNKHESLSPEFLGMFGPMQVEDETPAKEPEVPIKVDTPETALRLAREHLGKAVSLSGQVADYLYEQAQAEHLAGSYATAEIALEQSLSLNVSNYEGWLLLAETCLKLNRPQAAWKAAQPAIKLYRHREDGWLLGARAAAKGKEGRKAIECLEMYLKLNQTQIIGPLPFILMAKTYLELNEAPQALEQLEQAQTRLKAQFATPGASFLALRAAILNRLGKADESLELYQQALQLDPQNPALHNELGEALMEQGRYDESLKAFRQALQIEPNNARYHYNAGVVAKLGAEKPGQYSKKIEALQQQSIELLTKSTQLNPVMAQYWYELALAYAANRNFKLMRSALESAIAQSPAFSDNEAPQVRYMRLYATACQKLGDFETSRETLNKILAVLPDDHETLAELGEIAHRTGQYGDSYNYFRRAEAVSNDHPRYLASMARAMLRLNRWEEAHNLIEEAVLAKSDDYFVRHQLGAALVESGKPIEAMPHLHAAAEQEPGNADFRYYLGRAYLLNGRVAEAIHEYQEALTNAPLQHHWQAELGELYLKERAYLPALESLRVAVQLEPDNADYRYNLAIALAANGEAQQAIRQVRDVLDGLGTHAGAEWPYLLGRLLAELGRFDEALQSFAQANELEPENPNYKVDYARMLRLKGERIEEVKTLLEEAVAVNPGELRSVEELAYAYEASNNPEAAINVMGAHLSEVLEILRTV